MSGKDERESDHPRLAHLIRRFPQFERTIRELHVNDVGFQSKCDEYREVSEKLEGRDPSGRGATEEGTDALRRRRAALEEEFMGMIEGAGRV